MRILDNKKVAIFCSIKCPGNIVLAAFDLIQHIRDMEGIAISCFHSPIERECWRILSRGKQSIITVVPRSMNKMKLSSQQKKMLDEQRLLLLSCVAEKEQRVTSDTAMRSNRLAAALADTILVLHAEPHGKTEQLAREAISWSKPIFTLADKDNQNLISLGAAPLNSKKLLALAQERSF